MTDVFLLLAEVFLLVVALPLVLGALFGLR